MVSEKQLKANRKNAKKGGVKTEAGKAVVRYNAQKHGLLSQEVLLDGEDGDKIEELREGLVSNLQPKGALEEILTDRIVSSIWRLRRAIKAETRYIQDVDAIPSREKDNPELTSYCIQEGLGNEGVWLNLNRYETAIERQFYKALHELIRLQMARRGQQPPAPVALDIDVSA